MTYQEFKDEVNVVLLEKVGLTMECMADYRIRDAYDDGCLPEEVAYEILENDDSMDLDLLEELFA